MSKISIQGLNKAEVLAALYNAARPQGGGFLHYDPKPMTKEKAEKILETDYDFDYLKGRVMKINLQKDEFESYSYDRDNGEGLAAKVVAILRQKGTVNSDEIKQAHSKGVINAAKDVREALNTDTTTYGNTISLGLSHLKNEIEPKVNKALEDKGSKN